MALKCFYLNVFYIILFFYIFTLETLTESDEKFESYNVENSDFTSHCIYDIVPLGRNKRQTESSLEKKNETLLIEKSKLIKKPTAMEAKPTISITDSEAKQKGKVGFTKKEYLSTKSAATVPTPDTHDLPHNHDNDQGSELNRTHVEQNHSNNPESFTTSVMQDNNTTKLPASKDSKLISANITVPEDEIHARNFFEMNLNKTLKEHNIKSQQEDHHLYYNSSISTDSKLFQHYWVDMDKLKDVKDILPNSYRKAVTVRLNFKFPFYGHNITKIIIATGGFLYTGEYVHSWLSVTQYIAPLMANFDTASSNHSSIKYIDNGTAFTVQWENVVLQDKPDEGNFTFQCTLFKNGDIVFLYKHISVALDSIGLIQNAVKVGLSDAYIIDRTIFFVRRKTIYEYHRVNFEGDQIKSGTIIMLNALDTCLDKRTCHSCISEIPNFECNWCAGRCSNGMDRHRQDWLAHGCNNLRRKTQDECLAERMPLTIERTRTIIHFPEEGNDMKIGIAGILGILFVVSLCLGLGLWLYYAYRNPHSSAGQFLIRYRPSQWSWRRGEARYTAATIHM